MSKTPDRTAVSIEIDDNLQIKIETTFLQSKIKAIGNGKKPSRKLFYSYILEKGIADFDEVEFQEYLLNQNGQNQKTYPIIDTPPPILRPDPITYNGKLYRDDL